MQRLFYVLGTVLLLASLSACGVVNPEKPPSTYFLSFSPSQTATPKPNAPTLFIAEPQAAAGYESDALVYSDTPYQLKSYRNSRWIDTPVRMLQPLLVESMAATGAFSAILVSNSPTLAAQWRLESELLSLYQDFSTQPSQVHAVLRVQLLDLQQRQIVATKTFRSQVASPSDDAIGGISGANQAVANVLEQLMGFVKTLGGGS